MLAEPWQKFIQEQGGQFNAVNEVEFNSEADQTASSSAYRADLSYLGVIAVSGEDRSNFLQGQLTNDLRKITAEHSHLAAYCTPKGRMLALFHVIPEEDRLLLLLPQDLLVTIAKRLQMFVLMSKVKIEDRSTDLVRIGIGGNTAIEKLKQSDYQLPQVDNQVSVSHGVTFVKLADSSPRFICLGHFDSISKLWNIIGTVDEAVRLNSSNWKLKDIQAGLPQVYEATSEAFIPQMQNLQALDGISFKKGCYTGQEVVARMQYLGKLKRQMYLLESQSETIPNPGDPLFSPASSSAQGAGKVVAAQQDEQTRKVYLLAVLEIASADTQAIFLDKENQIACNILALPYALQSE